MRSIRLAAFVLAAAATAGLAQNTPPAQSTPAPSSQAAPAKKPVAGPQAQQAPGGGPDKVWVNNKSNVYHCPNDRYYGRTKDGKYMTEADAKKAGAHGVNNTTCFK